MPAQVYMLSYVGNYMAETVVRSLKEANNQDIEAYVNSGGGDVFAGWTMIGALSEYKGKTTAKVGGHAMSMAAMMLAYFDEVEALDVSNIMIHRADMYVSSPEDKAFLDKVNADMRRQLTSKIDDKVLKELKGVSIKNIFEDEKRIDVHLTAAEAKKIGLITKVVKLQPRKIAAYTEMFGSMFELEQPEQAQPQAAKPEPESPAQNPTPENSKPNTMTIDELKAKHPDVFAAAVKLGEEQERDRVQAIMVYADADIKAVKEAIDSGKPLTAKQTQEFLVKLTAGGQLQAVAADAGKPAPVTQAPAGDDKQKAAEAKLLASVNAMRKHNGLDPFKELPDAYKSSIVVES